MRTPRAYEDLFSRNLGVFTPVQLARIRGLTVAIAGVGGAGGALAVSLARLGVGELRLADPEEFEPSNINRQFGAYTDTIGVNKAEVIAEEILRINPEATVSVFADGVTEYNVRGFVSGCHCVIDEVDFYAVDAELVLHDAAREAGLPVFQGLMAGSLASFMWFALDGPSFRELFCPDDTPSIIAIISGMLPVLPVEAEAHPEMLAAVTAGERVPISSWAHSALVTGLFLLEDIVRVMVLDDPAIGPAPDLYCVDLHRRRFVFRRDGVLSYG
ncbi:MAG: ThiF family adenylyltransferase [Coriobacteriia bacterium]